jgi:hypothetical protein
MLIHKCFMFAYWEKRTIEREKKSQFNFLSRELLQNVNVSFFSSFVDNYLHDFLVREFFFFYADINEIIILHFEIFH